MKIRAQQFIDVKRIFRLTYEMDITLDDNTYYQIVKGQHPEYKTIEDYTSSECQQQDQDFRIDGDFVEEELVDEDRIEDWISPDHKIIQTDNLHLLAFTNNDRDLLNEINQKL